MYHPVLRLGGAFVDQYDIGWCGHRSKLDHLFRWKFPPGNHWLRVQQNTQRSQGWLDWVLVPAPLSSFQQLLDLTAVRIYHFHWRCAVAETDLRKLSIAAEVRQQMQPMVSYPITYQHWNHFVQDILTCHSCRFHEQ